MDSRRQQVIRRGIVGLGLVLIVLWGLFAVLGVYAAKPRNSPSAGQIADWLVGWNLLCPAAAAVVLIRSRTIRMLACEAAASAIACVLSVLLYFEELRGPRDAMSMIAFFFLPLLLSGVIGIGWLLGRAGKAAPRLKHE